MNSHGKINSPANKKINLNQFRFVKCLSVATVIKVVEVETVEIVK